MKIGFLSFGCRVNLSETAGMQALCEQAGFEVTSAAEEAEILVMNTCCVTEQSIKRLYSAMRRYRQKRPDIRFVLTGCYAQAYEKEAASAAGVLFALGTKGRSQLPVLLHQALEEKLLPQQTRPFEHCADFEVLPFGRLSGHTRAFLKIQDGCSCGCAYCIIPRARGPMRSMQPDALCAAVKEAAAAGYQELVLCGINLGFYGVQWGGDIAQAVQLCADAAEIPRLRLSSLEPDRLTEAVIAKLAAVPTLCPHFHISLQSGCDRTLRRMGRHYTGQAYQALCQRLRQYFPDCALSTDLMVGFPGESQSDFDESLEFVQSIGFAHTHIFRYSRRPGTRAAEMPDQIPESVKTDRMVAASAAAARSRSAHLNKQIGQITEVLFEQPLADGTQRGHTPDGSVLHLADAAHTDLLRGQLLPVQITGASDEYLIGVLR